MTQVQKPFFDFTKVQIKKAFLKCYGLKESINKDYGLQALSEQTGLTITYLKAHLNEIKAL